MVDSIKYEVERSENNIEIRRYAGIFLATVYGYSDYDAFSMLFDYISGKNKSKRSISMTAPVISSEEIAITAPVISDKRSFSFVMPAGYDLGTLPDPLDVRVKIEAIPRRRLAVIRFRGYMRSRLLTKKTSMLLTSTQRLGLETRGKPFLMRYNPPFTPGFLRRNEIGIELTP